MGHDISIPIDGTCLTIHILLEENGPRGTIVWKEGDAVLIRQFLHPDAVSILKEKFNAVPETINADPHPDPSVLRRLKEIYRTSHPFQFSDVGNGTDL